MTAWLGPEASPAACACCCDADAVDEWKGEPACSDCYERCLSEPCEDCGEKPCACMVGDDDAYALESYFGPDNDDIAAEE